MRIDNEYHKKDCKLLELLKITLFYNVFMTYKTIRVVFNENGIKQRGKLAYAQKYFPLLSPPSDLSTLVSQNDKRHKEPYIKLL